MIRRIEPKKLEGCELVCYPWHGSTSSRSRLQLRSAYKQERLAAQLLVWILSLPTSHISACSLWRRACKCFKAVQASSSSSTTSSDAHVTNAARLDFSDEIALRKQPLLQLLALKLHLLPMVMLRILHLRELQKIVILCSLPDGTFLQLTKRRVESAPRA